MKLQVEIGTSRKKDPEAVVEALSATDKAINSRLDGIEATNARLLWLVAFFDDSSLLDVQSLDALIEQVSKLRPEFRASRKDLQAVEAAFPIVKDIYSRLNDINASVDDRVTYIKDNGCSTSQVQLLDALLERLLKLRAKIGASIEEGPRDR